MFELLSLSLSPHSKDYFDKKFFKTNIRFSVLLFSALMALSLSVALQLRPEEKREETYPHSLDKCCNFAFRLYKVRKLKLSIF